MPEEAASNMRRRTRMIALALAALIFTAACTPEELVRYIDSTAEVRDVLSPAELSRLRQCESTDNYRAVSASGLYRGAYQFDQTTWNDVADRFFPWLVGVDPIDAEPWWQDAMTRALWSERGRQPWPICGYRV
jgi:Transglycosylase-like domain